MEPQAHEGFPLPGRQAAQSPAVLVAMLGARRHYAVPLILEQAGFLEKFCTDFFLTDRLAYQVLNGLAELFPARWLKRLASRAEFSLSGEKVRAFQAFGIQYALALKACRTDEERNRAYARFGERFAKKVAHSAWGRVNIVYAFNTVARELFQAARAHGIKCVLDQVSMPHLIMSKLYLEEAERSADWQTLVFHRSAELIERERAEWSLADRILCGSPFVVEGLVASGVAAEKCRLVPLGVDLGNFSPALEAAARRVNRPLRILFAGHVDIRKGIQDLCRALELLGQDGYQARAAGHVNLSERGRRRLAERCEILGQLPRPQMASIYRWADVFVLPSICEGSALVTYEALAAGLPVITTPNAGSPVRDGETGFIVPIRDSAAIADRLVQLADNPELQAEMGRRARACAVEYLSIAAHARRLVAAVSELVAENR